jgi:hypothetical protein
MVMGSTKDLHGIDEGADDNAQDLYGIDEGADDNALTMLTLPERNRKKRTLQPFFGSTMMLMTLLHRTTKIFQLIHFKACDVLHADGENPTDQKRLPRQ